MQTTSTLIRPQTCLIEVIIQPDASGNSVTPAYFSVEVTKFMLNRKLISLESYHGEDVQYSPLTPKMAVLPPALFLQATLTLLREPGNGEPGGDFYKNIPLSRFRRVSRLGDPHTPPDRWRCDPTGMSWSDSYVNITNPAGLSGVPVSALFLATFIMPDQDPAPYIGTHLKR